MDRPVKPMPPKSRIIPSWNPGKVLYVPFAIIALGVVARFVFELIN